MKLSEKMQGFRADRPSEWLMDEYIRDAKKLESEVKRQKEVIHQLKDIVKSLESNINIELEKMGL